MKNSLQFSGHDSGQEGRPCHRCHMDIQPDSILPFPEHNALHGLILPEGRANEWLVKKRPYDETCFITITLTPNEGGAGEGQVDDIE